MELNTLFQSIYDISPILAVIGVILYILWKKIEKSETDSKAYMEKNMVITRELMGEVSQQQEKRISSLKEEFNEYKLDVTKRMKEKDEIFGKVVESYRETINEFRECNTRIAKMEADISEIKSMVQSNKQ